MRIKSCRQEHDIDGAMAVRGNTEEVLAAGREKMLELYGENREIMGFSVYSRQCIHPSCIV